MNSRAASATSAKKAKQELVRLLYGGRYCGKGPDAHRKLDHSIYTYDELRKSYLEEVHSVHPDKSADSYTKADLHNRFVELQSAWDNYERFAKIMKSVSKGDKVDANFTMFGVGCSFSDSPEESAMRSEIMDQACRGWFSSGAISETQRSTSEDGSETTGNPTSALTGDEWFVSGGNPKLDNAESDASSDKAYSPPRRSLVDIPNGMRRR